MIEGENNLGIQNPKNKILSGVLRSDSFFYTTWEENLNFNKVCHSLMPADIFEEYGLWTQKIAVKSPFFSIVSKNFIEVNFEKIHGKYSYDTLIDTRDSFCLYRNPKWCSGVNFNVYHFLTIIHNYFLNRPEIWFIYFDEGHLHFYVKAANKFLYYNEYQYSSDKDVLYFIKLIEKSLAGNHSVCWQVSGKVTQDSKIFALLYNYVGDIKIYSDPAPEFHNFRFHEDIVFTYLCG